MDKKFTILIFLFSLFLTATPVQSVYSPPTVYISPSPHSGYSPLTVTCTVVGASDCFWDFRDGTNSTGVIVTHTYTQPGAYYPSLTCQTSYGTVNMGCGWIYAFPTIDFSASPTSGIAPLTMEFKDTSTGSPSSWSWDFGDGTNSTDQNPTHTYSKAGSYVVSFTPKYPFYYPSDAYPYGAPYSKSHYISVKTPPPIAAFFADSTSGNTPLTVTFTDTSTGNPTSWLWDFGDGNTSTQQNPWHTYYETGTYTVNLTVRNSNGANSKIITINVLKATPTITWNNPADIIAGTALSSTQLNAFANIAGAFAYTPAVGTVLSEGQQQTLSVVCTPTDIVNYDTASKDVTINVLEKPAVPIAEFWASPITRKAPLTVTFTDKSTGVPTSWFWDFGDKSTSTDKNPVYTYNKAGKYTVSLTVKNELGSNTRKISNYIIVNKK